MTETLERQDLPAVHRWRVRRRRRRRDGRGDQPGQRPGHRERPGLSPEDVDRAVNAAETAFETWKKTTPQDRSLLLLKIADALEAKADELGRLESANAGKPVGAAIDEMAVASTCSASSPAPLA